jgi:hypothetical protein
MSIDSDELAELRERVRRVRATLKPLPLPDEPAVETDGDEDVSGQCLRYAAAAVLRVPPRSLPRVPEGDDRWERWTGEMRAIGYHVEELPLDEIPPRDMQPWIAVVDASGNATTHAIPLVGLTALGRDELRSSITPAQVLTAFRFTAAA